MTDSPNFSETVTVTIAGGHQNAAPFPMVLFNGLVSNDQYRALGRKLGVEVNGIYQWGQYTVEGLSQKDFAERCFETVCRETMFMPDPVPGVPMIRFGAVAAERKDGAWTLVVRETAAPGFIPASSLLGIRAEREEGVQWVVVQLPYGLVAVTVEEAAEMSLPECTWA